MREVKLPGGEGRETSFQMEGGAGAKSWNTQKLGEMPPMSGNKKKGQVIEVFLCCARDIEFCSFYSGELFNAFKIGQVMNRIIYKKILWIFLSRKDRWARHWVFPG